MGKNKYKFRTIYRKNHEHLKNSKPSVQFYRFLLKKRVVKRLLLQSQEGKNYENKRNF